MGRNLTLEWGIGCVSCHESDRCSDDCICPSCWWPDRFDAAERDLAAAAWRFYAPVAKSLNDEGLNWGWATEEGHKSSVICSLELPLPGSDEWCEVARLGEGYVASHWRTKPGSRERNEPPEPVMLDELLAHTPDEVVNFVQNCKHAHKERL